MTSERVVELLNSASVNVNISEKLNSLKIVQELVIRKEPDLLDNFLDDVIKFQTDRSQDVRKFVVGFIEEACKNQPDLLPNVIENLRILVTDSAVAVQKRVIQAMTHLYRDTLAWLSKATVVTEDMEAVWRVVSRIKDVITHLLDAENDGMRTHIVKFMEMLVITQTYKEADSISSNQKLNEFSLDDVPLHLKNVKRRKLEEEANEIFEELIKYHESRHINSANLMTCMGALTNIAKCRPQFMSKVITALEMLQTNLPPTLGKSQVSSVRKHLKIQLLGLLKHPKAADPKLKYFTNITTLLTDLGASKEEVMKAMPKFEEVKKKVKKAAELAQDQSEAKRPNLEDEAKDEEESSDEEEDQEEAGNEEMNDSAVDITEKFILDRLNPRVAAEIVMRSMSFLPRDIPPHFFNTYTPIAAAGTEGQVKHVARLLATQLTSSKLGPGVVAMQKARTSLKRKADPEDVDGTSGKISTVIQGSISEAGGEKSKKAKVTLQPAGLASSSSTKRSKLRKIADSVAPFTPEQHASTLIAAFQRILSAHHLQKNSQIQKRRNKLLTSIATQSTYNIKHLFIEYLTRDIYANSELALSWLYEEYCYFTGFNRAGTMSSKRNDDTQYSHILCSLLQGLMGKGDAKEKDKLLRRFFLEVPIITDEAIQMLRQFIQVEGLAVAVVVLIRDLFKLRPSKKLNFLNFLLEFSAHDSVAVRDNAISNVLQLHANQESNDIIEAYSVMYLKFLQSPSPPPMLFGEDRGRTTVVEVWTDDMIKVCLYLFLSILPQNLTMFKYLSEVYVSSMGEIKRTILRVLDTTVQNIDMNDTNLLDLIENCPKGAETLITRVIHILTDKNKPTPQLVDKVRVLYEQRVSDVRFLIPVLSGLAKNEIIAALPKFISLSPGVVKEVFSRLLSPNSPITPSELLIALHNIEPSKCDMKFIIKAINMCFQEKAVFKQNVLTIVLQQLLEQPNIPLLFMRTIIQAVTSYPGLMGFIMNILQRLIVKQVWKESRIWDGFILCCEKTIPQSYAVMLQLPPDQLKLMLEKAPKIREPLLEHVQAFNESQRAHVPAIIMEVLYEKDVQSLKKSAVTDSDDKETLEQPPGEEETENQNT